VCAALGMKLELSPLGRSLATQCSVVEVLVEIDNYYNTSAMCPRNHLIGPADVHAYLPVKSLPYINVRINIRFIFF